MKRTLIKKTLTATTALTVFLSFNVTAGPSILQASKSLSIQRTLPAYGLSGYCRVIGIRSQEEPNAVVVSVEIINNDEYPTDQNYTIDFSPDLPASLLTGSNVISYLAGKTNKNDKLAKGAFKYTFTNNTDNTVTIECSNALDELH